MMRMLIIVLVVVPACVRSGFTVGQGPPSASDGGLPDGDGSPDGPISFIAELNEPCDPPACASGLVCTGVGTAICRPACGLDAGPCPDGEICGRPTEKPDVALACLTPTEVGLYGDCSQDPCLSDLRCLKGTTAACITLCNTDVDCGETESCLLVVPATGQQGCLPRCTADEDCPPTMRCTGFGPYPVDHCTPTEPVGLGSPCGEEQLCSAGLRCGGITGQTLYCYQICPLGDECPAAHSCVVEPLGTTVEICFHECDPLDDTVVCAPHEVCFVDPARLEAYCIPAAGSTVSCSGASPCVSGMICVDTYCRQACDDLHPCPGTMACVPLSFQGQPAPWKACTP